MTYLARFSINNSIDLSIRTQLVLAPLFAAPSSPFIQETNGLASSVYQMHSRKFRIPPGDVLLHAGDLSSWGEFDRLDSICSDSSLATSACPLSPIANTDIYHRTCISNLFSSRICHYVLDCARFYYHCLGTCNSPPLIG